MALILAMKQPRMVVVLDRLKTPVLEGEPAIKQPRMAVVLEGWKMPVPVRTPVDMQPPVTAT